MRLDAASVMIEVARAHGFLVWYEDQENADARKCSHWNLRIRNPKNSRELNVIQSFPCFDDYSFETWGSRKRQPIAHQDLRAVLKKIINLR